MDLLHPLKHRLVLTTILFSCCQGPTLETTFSEPPPQKPNIILIMADDIGISDIGAYGSEIKTPNIDRWPMKVCGLPPFIIWPNATLPGRQCLPVCTRVVMAQCTWRS